MRIYGQANNSARSGGTRPGAIILVIYLAMVAFLVYRIVKNHKLKSQMNEPYQTFQLGIRPFSGVLVGLLVVMGMFTLMGGDWITGIIMIVLSILMLVVSREEVVVGVDGILASNLYFTWNEVRRWSWSPKGHLLLDVKKRGKPLQTYQLPGGRNMSTKMMIDNAIKKFKLKK